ncbi:MAG TPA: TetR/AcrR family transcriptional regulator [Ktedonobacteraceae bacterium]
MARIVNEAAHAARRNAILDAAQRAIVTKGYEQMAIADLLGELGISSGAFYHYFDSKPTLLEALVERMGDQAEQVVAPILHDPALPALEKLQRFFAALDQWKVAHKSLVLEYMRCWYSDENAIVRYKLRVARYKRLAPWLEAIIYQGIEEGVLQTPYPDQATRLIVGLFDDLGYVTFDLLCGQEPTPDDLPRFERILAATTDTLEYVLGAPKGCLQHFVTREEIEQWLPRSTGQKEEQQI